MKSNKEKYSFLPDLLTKKRFEIWRHIFLILSIAIIEINSTLITYGKNYSILENKIYWIILFSLILDMTIIYFNLYIIVPKLLLKSKYLQYTVTLLILITFSIVTNLGFEYFIFKPKNTIFDSSLNSYSEINLIIELVRSFLISGIYIVGISMSVLFKSWLMNIQRMNQLETEDLRSQLERMKEKVSPSFLSRILKKSASLAISAPEESSAMLLNLSKILRYQLYDCGRDKVLLSSEIVFLTNYLSLEKNYLENFDFIINKNGDMTHLFIPPLLFLPFIQQSIISNHELNNKLILQLSFLVENNLLQFSCISNNVENINYSQVNHRLELLYHNKYSIKIQNEKELTIQIAI